LIDEKFLKGFGDEMKQSGFSAKFGPEILLK
jgi:hypothetical protein